MNKPTGQLEEWEWIEKYWLGRLSASDQAYFDALMKKDDRLASEAQDLRFGVQLVEEARLAANARRTLDQLKRQRQQRRQQWIRWGGVTSLLAAASIAFTVYLAYAPLTLPIRENDPGVLREFRHHYQADASDNLSLRQKHAFDRFFEGQVYLSEGRPQLAALRFEAVLTFPELRPYFREAAQWHLLICYVKTKQITKANQLYRQLDLANDYEFSRLERWKIWWHLRRLTWFGVG